MNWTQTAKEIEADRLILPAVTGHDLHVLSKTLYGEARGEGEDGMGAVAAVIRNRVHADLHGDALPDWWGEGYAGVCLKPWQFSCWNENDPNRARLEALQSDDPLYVCAFRVSVRCVHWEYRDPTGGCTHYCTVYSRQHAPQDHWSRQAAIRFALGRHVFFSLT